MNTLRLAFGFLMFHRRIIIGLMLIAGLYYFITDIVPRISASRREAALNRPNSVSSTATGKASTAGTSNNGTQEKSNESESNKSATRFLKSENPEELVTELIRLKDLSKEIQNDAFSLLISADIIKIAKRLMELPIDLNQRKFALGSLTDALLLMRLAKINSNLADESIDQAFLEKMKELLADRDPEIRSSAAVTIITSAVFDYHVNPTDDRLKTLEQLLEEHFEAVAKNPLNLSRVIEVMLKSKLTASDNPQVKALFNRLGEKFVAHQDPDVSELGRSFEERLTFKKLDIENLIFYLGEGSASADLKADAFFETLEAFPEASIPVYQKSLDVIREYRILNRNDRANQLASKLEQDILPKRKDSDSRARIQKALDELKTKLVD